jgi:hypothetical protein
MKLDIGCGHHKELGWFGMDIQPLQGVDLVHDLNVHPWPVESGSVEEAKAWHIVEHIPPVAVTERGTRRPFIEFMDEIWRVMRVGGRRDIETPNARSAGFWHDPTHCNPCTEVTFENFDPCVPRYETYRPRPWRIISRRWDEGGGGQVNVVLEKIGDGEE